MNYSSFEIKSGFYDSINGDRRYSAVEFSKMFDGIITNGVFAHVGEKFKVTFIPEAGIQVGSGRAWAFGRWAYLDHSVVIPNTKLTDLIAMAGSNASEEKELGVFLIIDWGYPRNSTITVSNGKEVEEAFAEQYISNGDSVEKRKKYIFPLAGIQVTNGTVTNDSIKTIVGTEMCPYVSGVLEKISIDEHFMSFEEQWKKWFDHIKDSLNDFDIGNLRNEIDNYFSGNNEMIARILDICAQKLDSNNPIMEGIPKQSNPMQGKIEIPASLWITRTVNYHQATVKLQGLSEKHSIILTPISKNKSHTHKNSDFELSKWGIRAQVVVEDDQFIINCKNKPDTNIELMYRVVI